MKKILIGLFLLGTATSALVAQTTAEPEKEAPAKEIPATAIRISVSTDNVIRIQHATSGMQMELYSIVGIKLATYTLRSADESIRIEQPKGYYIVKIANVVRKVIIR
ncbi:MAG: T9SS type A sorting domain-containing protein [Prevotellaceae bacterium]|nr:T9SS type A sorting domain-containing protein [Prevotellaceae bacterium]